MLDHRPHEHRRTDHDRDVLAFEQLERAPRFPRVHQHRSDARRHGQQDRVRQPGDVRDRHRHEHRFARPHVVRGRNRVRLDPQRLVRMDDALRIRRRPGGPQDQRRLQNPR